MSKYYSIHEFSKIIGVSAQTLRNWDANGKLHPHHTTVSGYRYYSDEQLNQVINVKPKKDLKLSDRIYKCDCGNVIDRDFQASINLKAYGERVAS